MSMVYDVIIAGAGPIGLFLACELGLAHVTVLVLERDVKAESPWKSNPLGRRGLNTIAVEGIYRRGMLSKLFDPAKRQFPREKKAGFQFGGHFAGIAVNANALELDRWKYLIPGPGLSPGPVTIEQLETMLSERAESLGVTILRGTSVTKVSEQSEDSVTVEAGDDQTFHGRWLVGCDGGRSVVRKTAGFDFAGTEAKFTGYAAQCDIENVEKLAQGFHTTKSGMYVRAWADALHLMDFDGASFDRTKEITKEHLQDVVRRVTGVPDVKITKIHLASSFTDRSKQATTYRKGRVLLAGDAAHIHSPIGAQGLNLGLGDAMNLGWKLAATVRQESGAVGSQPDLTLLDTYEKERHPIGERILDWTRAQVSTLEPTPFGAAIQALVRDLINTADGTNMLIERLWGFSLRYDLGNGDEVFHPLVGCSVPDFELQDGSRLGSKLEQGKGLLVDFEDDSDLKDMVVGEPYATRVDYVGVDAKDCRDLRALLIRPDGVVAWVTEKNQAPDVDAAKAGLKRWFGS
ncbi:uncharacterized protein A1O9_06964 [Exophiala aquamarina CBS 119918]|uniref:FAD-binding domain-containing protein n=1 Tax=Exophiala aquamarina CBS 119918 TaxID=1182545 RepID=A0A072P9M1_9EURO|nr:uncharacterized protein A1O9_06964 [Exophiala aquamarina CBS 119918]KEF56774.1 hypothetical protein A1O9_06964 [Exophiala aquamarina CBS 119918]